MSLALLLPLFALVALFYSMVGFGGGSSYLALLTLSELDHSLWRPLALICNVVVVSSGTWFFLRRGHFSWKLFAPFVLTSVPMAYWGGTIQLEKRPFLFLLGGCLLLAGLRMALDRRLPQRDATVLQPRTAWLLGLPLGAVLGCISGLVGMGGGIFLAPILYMLGWGQPKQIAATASAFILVNSVAGLAGYASQAGSLALPAVAWWLPLAVLIAGQLGSRLGSGAFPAQRVRQGTALLVLLAGSRILWQLLA